jgi:DNA repair protein RadA/Sms
MQVLHNLSKDYDVLYTTGEEDLTQVKSRAIRLDADITKISAQYATSIEDILHSMRKFRPDFMVVDAVQTLDNPNLKSSPGSPSQIKSCVTEITAMAKALKIGVILIGHFTKAKGIAGPNALMHIIDAVIMMERDMLTGQTIVSATKNRMGSTSNIGLLRMEEKGFVETSYEELLRDKRDKLMIPMFKDGRFSVAEIDCDVSFGKKNISAENIQMSHIKRVIKIARKVTGLNFEDVNISIRSSEAIDKDDVYADLGIFAAILLSHLMESPKGYLVAGHMSFDGSVDSNNSIEEIVNYCKQAKIKRVISPSSNGGESFIQIKEVEDFLGIITGVEYD